ncbi:CREB-regulated transcription coactivator 1 isoform X2 [Sitophilus oryzae]|uniref:CREB-regulated transcription coactivator 1 isoform X2 n=1 Tax=Sitophilus oryzae TaxID=7048 RepID=A0A6J2XTH8_SITOR|nr:CREB-regulated transcription coactivator 1 isoform X2 [Sitophilus oryzae]
MANPRKFSEKIALHTHRQAEETAAFEKIMKEVSDVKVGSPRIDCAAQNKNTLRIGPAHQGPGLGTFRGGSLPDVSAPRPVVKMAPSTTTVHASDSITKPNEECPQTRMINPTTRQSRTRSPGGPIRSTRDRKPSPYSSGPYLSPPSDTGWRRTNSDSALHQSAMQGMGMERGDPSQRVSWGMLPTMNGPERIQDGRPRSSCDLPRTPGIHIYPSAHDPGIVQIPIGNNTGSLPDLTNMDFTSPIHVPLDQDQDSSPYSSSPINTSPSTLSPTSMMAGVRTHNRFNFASSPISQPLSNHLLVPSNSRYHHRSLSQSDKNIGLDASDFSQLGAMAGMYHPGSPSSPVLSPIDGYRSPRPSPQPSPTLGGRHSAPCSPGEPSPLSNDYHIQNQNMQFQQHFEQLTVSDSPIGQMQYTDQSTNPQMSQSHGQNMNDVTADTGYFSTSPSQQLVFPSPSPGLQNTSPNTPTSVPEIILTDFSGSADMRQLDNEFLTDELKEGLGALDLVELQMLNSSIGISEIVEDFRS